MAGEIAGIPELIKQGGQFTFENFSSKSEYGTPNALSADWLVWTHQVGELVENLGHSPIRKSIEAGLAAEVIGHEAYVFDGAKGQILNGLRAADRVFGAAIPASDRTVMAGGSLGHG
jgi:hypothetical protein